MKINLGLVRNMLRLTKFGQKVEHSLSVYLGIGIAIVSIILAIIGAVDYYKKNKKTFGNVKDVSILFYSYESCGHCKDFQKTWDELVKLTSKNKNIHTEQIEATQNPQRIEKDGIMYFPTIKINGIEYNGPRTTDAILASAGLNDLV